MNVVESPTWTKRERSLALARRAFWPDIIEAGDGDFELADDDFTHPLFVVRVCGAVATALLVIAFVIAAAAFFSGLLLKAFGA